MTQRFLWILAGSALASGACSQSHIGYVVRVVPGGTNATITGAYGGKLVGYISNGVDAPTAAVWPTPLSSPTLIAFDARIHAIYGDRYVGVRNASTAPRATLWNGIAGPVVDLHDPSAETSAALCIFGTKVGGAVTIGGHMIGRVWNASATAFLDLQSSVLSETIVRGIGPSAQVGWGMTSVEQWPRALKWLGSTASCQSLLPWNSLQGEAVGMSGAFAAGTVTFESTTWGGFPHREAYAWDPAADVSWSLHPFVYSMEPADNSEATAIGGAKVAGSATWNGTTYPFVWTQTGGSWVPQALHGYASGNPSQVTLSAVDPITGEIAGRAGNEAVVFSPVFAQHLEVKVSGTASAHFQCTEDLRHQTQSPFLASLSYYPLRTFLEYMRGRLVTLTPDLVTPTYELLDRLELDGAPWAGPITMDVDHVAEAVYRAGEPLTVSSLSPDAGVSVTVWTADHAKRKDGSTPFVRAYEPGKTVSLTAPVSPAPGRVFGRWAKDGITVPGTARTVTLAMDAPHQMRAVYVNGGLVSFTSSEPGVSIVVYQADGYGLRDGQTPFQRLYPNGNTVAASAPATAGSHAFVRWEKDGVAQPSGLRTVKVTVSGGRALRAVYAP